MIRARGEKWRRVVISCVAGLGSGFLILGIGGRALMRLLALLTPEAPRFTWAGTAQIVGLAAVWGLVTGPLILVAARWTRAARFLGPVFGLVVFVLAAIPFLLYSGFNGEIVAPPAFLWLGALTFPLLFVLHGTLVRVFGG